MLLKLIFKHAIVFIMDKFWSFTAEEDLFLNYINNMVHNK